jgi:hypothetical protein
MESALKTDINNNEQIKCIINDGFDVNYAYGNNLGKTIFNVNIDKNDLTSR